MIDYICFCNANVYDRRSSSGFHKPRVEMHEWPLCEDKYDYVDIAGLYS